jgi:hypothetical protein
VAKRRFWTSLGGHPLDELDLARRGLSGAEELERDDALWPGQLAVLTALLLYLALPPKLTIGPNWLIPSAELVLFLGLVVAAPRRAPDPKRRRLIALGLLLVVTVANLVALSLMTHYLIRGGHARGADLIGGGLVVWGTNLLIFGVWYWEIDRGGPIASKEERRSTLPDFLFPQMSDDRYAPPGWKPRFGDYLYFSLTNQTAFSPTDTMPLTIRAKILMSIQGIAALVTVGIIVARAVNILG